MDELTMTTGSRGTEALPAKHDYRMLKPRKSVNQEYVLIIPLSQAPSSAPLSACACYADPRRYAERERPNAHGH